jgi:hypothetical protein
LSGIARRLDTWIWVFVFAGIFVFGLGLAVARTEGGLGLAIAGFGGLLVVVGALMVWARSRIKSSP